MEKRNISVAKVNGYTLEKVKLAKQYLSEIGTNKRNFNFNRLIEMYNSLLGTHESPNGCRCQAPKYYNGILNFYNFGKATLLANNIATEAEIDGVEEVASNVVENAENRIVLGKEELAQQSGFTSVEEYEEEVKAIEEELKEEVKEVKKVGRPKKVKE